MHPHRIYQLHLIILMSCSGTKIHKFLNENEERTLI